MSKQKLTLLHPNGDLVDFPAVQAQRIMSVPEKNRGGWTWPEGKEPVSAAKKGTRKKSNAATTTGNKEAATGTADEGTEADPDCGCPPK